MANDNNIQPVADDSQIVLYQPDESISLQVKNRWSFQNCVAFSRPNGRAICS